MVLKKFRMFDSKACSTPMEMNLKIKSNVNDIETSKPFRQLLGCLNYIANMTRPDICFSVNYLSQFQDKPTDEMYQYCKRILRYLKGTIHYKLRYKYSSNFDLDVFVDSDFGGDINDRKSKTSYVFRLGENIISWKTKKQTSVAQSPPEAEYVAMANSAEEGMWLKQLLNDLDVSCNRFIMFEDNKGATTFSHNNDNNGIKCKHIDVKFRFINDEIEKGKIKVNYIESHNQIADIFTKPLDGPLFVKHRNSLLYKE